MVPCASTTTATTITTMISTTTSILHFHNYFTLGDCALTCFLLSGGFQFMTYHSVTVNVCLFMFAVFCIGCYWNCLCEHSISVTSILKMLQTCPCMLCDPCFQPWWCSRTALIDDCCAFAVHWVALCLECHLIAVHVHAEAWEEWHALIYC